MAPVDLGPAILAETDHEVFAAPYHRNNDGTLAMLQLMLAQPSAGYGCFPIAMWTMSSSAGRIPIATLFNAPRMALRQCLPRAMRPHSSNGSTLLPQEIFGLARAKLT